MHRCPPVELDLSVACNAFSQDSKLNAPVQYGVEEKENLEKQLTDLYKNKNKASKKSFPCDNDWQV